MIRTTLLAAVLLATSVGVAGAHEPVLAGDVCELSSSFQQENVGAQWTAVLSGGPIAAADVSLVSPSWNDLLRDNPMEITVTCAIRRYGAATYADPALASASVSGRTVATVPPTVVQYEDPDFFGVGVCTQVSVTDRAGATYDYYWDVYEQRFTRDVNTYCGPVFCPLSAGRSACGGGGFPPGDVIEALNAVFDIVNGVILPLDPAICAQLVGLAATVDGIGHPEWARIDPATGDTFLLDSLIWDCPPYEP